MARFENLLVAVGEPGPELAPDLERRDKPSFHREDRFYYDAMGDVLYSYTSDAILPFEAAYRQKLRWQVVSKDCTKDNSMPILQFYYDLYHEL